MPNGCWARDECIEPRAARRPPAPTPTLAGRLLLHYVIIPNAAAAPPGIKQGRIAFSQFFILDKVYPPLSKQETNLQIHEHYKWTVKCLHKFLDRETAEYFPPKY